MKRSLQNKVITSKSSSRIAKNFSTQSQKTSPVLCPDVTNKPIPEPLPGTEKSLIGSDLLKWTNHYSIAEGVTNPVKYLSAHKLDSKYEMGKERGVDTGEMT